MKQNNSFLVATKNGENQKFNCYHRNKTGKFALRFYTVNYIPEKSGKKKTQWSGKKCTFNTKDEAIRAGYSIASACARANDVHELRRVVELRSDYIDTFGATV